MKELAEPTELAKHLAQLIQTLPSNKIKQYLLTQLNPNAESCEALFIKEVPSKRTLRLAKESPLPYILPLNIVFCFAPESVCQAVAEYILEEPEKLQFTLLNDCNRARLSTAQFIEPVFHTIMHYAPPKTRELLASLILTWSDHRIVSLLGGKFTDKCPANFDHFLKLINKKDEAASLIILQALFKLDNQQLCLILNNRDDDHDVLWPEDAIIDFFKTKPEENAAILMLKRLRTFGEEALRKYFFGSGNGEKNLLHIFLPQASPASLPYIFKVLEQLPEREQLYLLKKRVSVFRDDIEHSLTPLDLVFYDRRLLALTPLLIKELSCKPAFLSLLTTGALARFDSPMHAAVRLHNIAAFQAYIEIKGTHLEHYSAQLIKKSKRSLLELAKEVNFHYLNYLHQALPIYRFIFDDNSKKSIAYLEDHEKNITDPIPVFTLEFQDKKTLLHYAARQGDDLTIQYLLTKPIDVNAVDAHGLTALETAITHQHWECANQLLMSPQLDYYKPLKNGQLPLVIFLEQNQLLLIRNFLLHIKKSDQKSYELMASALKSCHKYAYSFSESLDNTLFYTKQTSFTQTIHEYCQTSQDGMSFFLHMYAQMLSCESNKSNQTLFSAMISFIKQQLHQLLHHNSPLKKQAIRSQLILLLFSCKTSMLKNIYEEIGKEAKELEMILCHGLIKPLILTAFSYEEQYELHSLLSEASFKSMARVHLEKSDLTMLSPLLLKKLTSALSTKKLLSLCQNRRNGILFALTLDRIRNKQEIDPIEIKTLSNKLLEEIELLNHKPHPHALLELRHILSLITHPQSKIFIQTIFPLHDKSISHFPHLKTLYKTFDKQFPYHKKSFLHDLYLYFATSEALIDIHAIEPSLSDFIACLKVNDFQTILDSQHRRLIVLQRNQSLFQSEYEHEGPHAAWLMHIALKTSYHYFLQVIELVSNTIEQIQNLNQDLNVPENLQNALLLLQNLQGLLEKQRTSPTLEIHHYDKQITECLLHIKEQAIEIKNFFESIVEKNQQTDWPIFNKIQPIFSLLENTLPEIVHSIAQFIKKQQDTLLQTMEDHLQRNSIKTSAMALVSEPIPDPKALTGFIKLTENQPAPHENIFVISQNLIAGVLNNPIQASLLTSLIVWLYRHNQLAQFPLKNLTHVLPLMTLEEQQSLRNFLQKRLQHYHQIQALEQTLLQLAAQTDLSDQDIGQLLQESELPTLKEYYSLCRQAHAQQLALFMKTAITCKINKMSLTDWLKKNPMLIKNKVLSIWLQRELLKVQQQAETLMSFSAAMDGINLTHCNIKERLESFSQAITHYKLNVPAQAILTIAHSYRDNLQKDLLSEESCQLMAALAQLLEHAHLFVQMEVISQLPPDLRLQLLEHCLSGLSSLDQKRAQLCRKLLISLIEYSSSDNQDMLMLIKQRLSQQDMLLMAPEKLKEIAQHVLKDTHKNLQDLTLDGIWIQRLLISPEFIAESPDHFIAQLIERYRLISLTLKQDEFNRLNQFLQGKLLFGQKENEDLKNVYLAILHDDDQKHHFILKRDRLLKFRSDDAVRALLNQLEINCLNLSEKNPQIVEKARYHLYYYLNQQLSSLRSDVFFKITDFIYTRTFGQYGDLEIINNTLAHWMQKYLPHKNFEQMELSLKKTIQVFNAKNQKIGYINEANQILTLQDHQPVPLITLDDYQPGMELYNEQRQRIGILDHKGYIQHHNVFQSQTSALLLAKLPEQELLHSPAALDLLLGDVLQENQLETLYQKSEVTQNLQKRQWLDDKLISHTACSQRNFSGDTLRYLVQHQSDEKIVILLNTIRLQKNALTLFLALCEQTKKRSLLFTQNRQALYDCLMRFEPKTFLAEYLIHAHQMSYFNQGLQCFADYAEQYRHPALLNEALAEIAIRLDKQMIKEKTIKTMMSRLITAEETAHIIMQAFFQDKAIEPIHTACHKQLQVFTGFFVKENLIPVIETLNKTANARNSSQYRLLLMILYAQHDHIFHAQELRLSRQHAWQAEELLLLIHFLKTHLNQDDKHDSKQYIAKKLLSELVLRTANFGLVSLFYEKNNRLDQNIVHTQLERKLINASSTRFFKYWQKSSHPLLERLKTKLSPQYKKKVQKLAYLEKNHALIDWQKLSQETWQLAKKDHMPLLTAYLFNYSGSRKMLEKLLHDVLFLNKDESLQSILQDFGRFIVQLPQRDISAVLFQALERKLHLEPHLLDETLLLNMAQYYQSQLLQTQPNIAKKQDDVQAIFALMKHFGHQKSYSLVMRISDLLTIKLSNNAKNHSIKFDDLEQALKRIKTEAQVERSLSKYLASWFFVIAQFFMRLWHGTRHAVSRSQYIKYCDDLTDYQTPVVIPDEITTPVAGGSTVRNQLKQHDNLVRVRNMKKRLDKLFEPHITPHTYGFFEPVKKRENEEERVLGQNDPSYIQAL